MNRYLIRTDAQYPELFGIDDSKTPSTDDVSTMVSIVLAHASRFPESASRLSSLQTLPIPEAAASSRLITLKPRVDKAMQEHSEQDVEVADLRTRSAWLMKWWVNVGVVGMGECWADWEGRLRECERSARKLERRIIPSES